MNFIMSQDIRSTLKNLYTNSEQLEKKKFNVIYWVGKNVSSGFCNMENPNELFGQPNRITSPQRCSYKSNKLMQYLYVEDYKS